MKLLAIVLLCVCAGQVEAGSIFDREYTKYSRGTYERHCGHHLTPGGYWDCLDALDKYGVPHLECSDPVYVWAKDEEIKDMIQCGWKGAPLNFIEFAVNPPHAPWVYWFYKCTDKKKEAPK